MPANFEVVLDPRYEPGGHGIGRSRGGLATTCHALVDGHGVALVLLITPGRIAGTCVTAGSPPSSRSQLTSWPTGSCCGRAGGRPVNVDRVLYERRNVVERAFNELKNWCGIATRYDKHAVNYRGGVVLGAIVLWLRHFGTSESQLTNSSASVSSRAQSDASSAHRYPSSSTILLRDGDLSLGTQDRQ